MKIKRKSKYEIDNSETASLARSALDIHRIEGDTEVDSDEKQLATFDFIELVDSLTKHAAKDEHNIAHTEVIKQFSDGSSMVASIMNGGVISHIALKEKDNHDSLIKYKLYKRLGNVQRFASQEEANKTDTSTAVSLDEIDRLKELLVGADLTEQ